MISRLDPVINNPLSVNSIFKFYNTGIATLLETALAAVFKPLTNSSRLIVNLI